MKNKIIKVKCFDISKEGYGIAKKDNLVIFVKDLIIDEEANIKIIKENKNYLIGIIDELILASPYRKSLDCNIAYKCGGCDFRHLYYEYQLILKKRILTNIFYDKDYHINDVIKCDNPYYYRNKTQIPFRNNHLGFYRKHSNDIVEFDVCLIQDQDFNNIIKDLKELLNKYQINEYIKHIFMRKAYGTNEIMLCLIVNDLNINNLEEINNFLLNKYNNIKSFLLNLNERKDNVILGDEIKIISGNDYIIDIFDDLKVKISLKSFYQINYYQMLKMYHLIKDLADINKETRVLDLYSGIGTISLFLARYAKEVIGIEIVKDAVKDAKDNARINNINNVLFYEDDATKNIEKYLKDIDVVIVDPPRKGLSNDLINKLIINNIKKIIYVSCNPLTLKRDLDILEEYYDIKDINPLDVFCFSKHLECITMLIRKI